MHAHEPLGEDVIVDGPGSVVRDPEAVSRAIRAAMDRVAPSAREVALLVPDETARVFILEFDSFPENATLGLPIIRFRMRRMLPFDVESAAITYQVLSRDGETHRVLIAAMPGPVRAEYEAVVAGAGCAVGLLLPVALKALEMLDSTEPVLSACLTRQTLTTAISSSSDLLLYRTLDLPCVPEERIAELQRGIAVAAAYFEDKVKVRADRIYCTGLRGSDEFAACMEDLCLKVIHVNPAPSAVRMAGSQALVDGGLTHATHA
jgi:type IV pilus assembly protein PilM